MPMNLSLGIGIGHNGGPIFDPDARAWFAAMPTQPTNQVKVILSDFIEGLKDDNLWSKIDGGNVLCLQTLAQGLVDFKVPSRVATLAPGFTSVFTRYRGVTGSGSLSASQDAYIDTGYIPSTHGVGYLQDSFHVGVFIGNNSQNANYDLGCNSAGADNGIIARNASDQLTVRSNNATTNAVITGITDSSGFSLLSRVGAAESYGYKNGVSGPILVTASTGVPNVSMRYLQVISGTATLHQIAFACYGGGLSAAEAALLNTRVQTLMAALQALPAYDTDASAWFVAMPTQLTLYVKNILNDFIEGLKTDNLWTLIDGGNFLCLETLDQGLVDFKVPSRVATTAPGFTSTFTSYRWVTGSGSASGSQDAYIEIPFNPSTAGGNWALNSVHTCVACGNDVAGSTVELGMNTAAEDYYHVVRNASSSFQVRSNSSATSGIAGMASSIGVTIASRTGTNAIGVYANGSLLGNVTTQASVAVPNANLRVLQAQSSLASTKQVQALTYGGGLDATQAANLNTRVQTAISALTVL